MFDVSNNHGILIPNNFYFSSSLQDNWILKEVSILSDLYDSVETVAE